MSAASRKQNKLTSTKK